MIRAGRKCLPTSQWPVKHYPWPVDLKIHRPVLMVKIWTWSWKTLIGWNLAVVLRIALIVGKCISSNLDWETKLKSSIWKSFNRSLYDQFPNLLCLIAVCEHGYKIWPQSGSDWPLNLIWKFPGFVPFGANLTHFGAKSGNRELIIVLIKSNRWAIIICQ